MRGGHHIYLDRDGLSPSRGAYAHGTDSPLEDDHSVAVEIEDDGGMGRGVCIAQLHHLVDAQPVPRINNVTSNSAVRTVSPS